MVARREVPRTRWGHDMTYDERREMYRRRYIRARNHQLIMGLRKKRVPVPEHLEAGTHEVRVADNQSSDIFFQQCGGGRRVIKKRVGGS